MLHKILTRFWSKICSHTVSRTNNAGGQKTVEETLNGIFHLSLRDVMIPRADIHALNYQARLEDVANAFTKTQSIALPIFRGSSLDRILGILRVQDLLKLIQSEKTEWQKEILPATFVAPSLRLDEALVRLSSSKAPFLLVVDEYGGIDGLVTLPRLTQHIIEPLKTLAHIGTDTLPLQELRPGVWIVDGRLTLDALKNHIRSEQWPKNLGDNVDTVGGLVCQLAGRVPRPTEIILHPESHMVFEVIDADIRRVKQVALHLPSQKPQEDE